MVECSQMKMNRREFNITLLGAVGAMATMRVTAQTALRVKAARLNAHLAALAESGKTPQGGVSRVAYSDADRHGRDYAMRLMREARLDVTIDAAGNLVGQRKGSAAQHAPLVIGSHIDSVPEGGNYDGDVGSLSA